MPTVDDELQRRIHRAAPVPPDTATVEGIYRRKHRRSIVRRASAVGVVVLVLAGALVAFAAVDRPNTLVTPGVSTPAPLADDLGLPFPTCRVSSMPMTSELGGGSAAVFTKESDGGCPKANDGFVGVGVDVTGDGLLDATAGPLPDCYFRCEAFAAPDVNGDGVSEIAVSTEGADGFGVWLYAVTTTPPSIEPIIVSSTFDQGPPDGDPLQFAWVDVATPRVERRVRHNGRSGLALPAVRNGEAHARAGTDDIDDRPGDDRDGHGDLDRHDAARPGADAGHGTSAARRSTDRRSA